MKSIKNQSLKAYNTFGIDVIADQFLAFKSMAELIHTLKQSAKSPLILGGGSNILFTSNYDGLVLKNEIKGIEIIEETDAEVLVRFGAGENWHQCVLYAIAHQWGGIENLSLIPGTIGAAPMQNIGAYGVEIKEVFESLTAVNISTQEIQTFTHSDCKFGYRESVFKNELKNQYIITDVTLRLSKSNHELNTSYGAIADVLNANDIISPSIKDVSDAVISIRKSKLPDPKEIGNAGSFFKNPTIDKLDYESLKLEFPEMPGYTVSENEVKVPAGWLIEYCGWKGKTRGAIGVHKNQALVLVNFGDGSGAEIKQLAADIQESVVKQFGIDLSPEVNII